MHFGVSQYILESSRNLVRYFAEAGGVTLLPFLGLSWELYNAFFRKGIQTKTHADCSASFISKNLTEYFLAR